MIGWHKVSISAKRNNTAEIIVDGRKIEDCVGYTITQKVSEPAIVDLTIRCFVEELSFNGEQEPQKEG